MDSDHVPRWMPWAMLAVLLIFFACAYLDCRAKFSYDAQPTTPDSTHEIVWCFEDEAYTWVTK